MPLTVQKGFWGREKFLADTKQKLANLYYQKPEAFEKEKQVILEYWQTYEGLGNILKDKLPAFIDWFMSITSPETITRCLRSIKVDGTVRLGGEQIQQRQEREQEWHDFWGNEARQRYRQ